ncbi:MAG TPA: right-handed parallel beta-helix repeat-containing protein [Syntrophorhabdales bacterium]|nr:right-handed parallel beta-helix repeat-containing protein [Syntrophorhabdales bacterium]
MQLVYCLENRGLDCDDHGTSPHPVTPFYYLHLFDGMERGKATCGCTEGANGTGAGSVGTPEKEKEESIMKKLLLVIAFIALSAGTLNAQTVVNLPSGNVAPFTVQSSTTYMGVAGSTVINCNDKLQGIGINGRDASNVTLKNIEVTNCRYGILSQANGVAWTLDGVNAHGNFFGMAVGAWENCTPSYDFLITNSHFDNNDSDGLAATNLLRSNIRDNTFNGNCTCTSDPTGNSGNCTWCGGYREDDLCLSENPPMPGNVYDSNTANGNVNGAGIWLDTCGTGAVVRYNTLNSNQVGLMNEITSGTEAYGNTGTGNTMACIWVEGRPGATYSQGGIQAPANNNYIHDNVCTNNSQFGLLIQDGGGYVSGSLMNNTIANNTSTGTINGPDIRFVYGGTTNKVTNNQLGPDRAYMIEAPVWGGYISLTQFNTLPGATGNYTGSTPPPCTPLSTQTQTLSCPAGQTGSITQQRLSTCPGPTWGPWTTISNTCSVTCTPLPTQTRTVACPTGYTGSITEQRISSCPGPTWGAWTQIANTCTPIPPPPPPATQYTINAAAQGPGSISPSGSVSVRQNGSVTFKMSPNDPRRHVQSVVVDGKSVGAAASYTFSNVKGNHTIRATFR